MVGPFFNTLPAFHASKYFQGYNSPRRTHQILLEFQVAESRELSHLIIPSSPSHAFLRTAIG